jgi:PAS domain S-box-containing protein
MAVLEEGAIVRERDKTQKQLIRELETSRRRIAELEEAARHQHSLFEYSGESIFVVDLATLRFLLVNGNAARRLGYSRQELLQMTLEQVEVPPPDSAPYALAWESTVSGTAYYECVHLRKDGSEMPVEVSSRLAQSGDRQVLLHFVRDTTKRKQRRAEREQLVRELQAALAQVKTLSGLLPICANCKKIRDDEGYWHSVEAYVSEHSQARFSHGICPECMAELYPHVRPPDETQVQSTLE